MISKKLETVGHNFWHLKFLVSIDETLIGHHIHLMTSSSVKVTSYLRRYDVIKTEEERKSGVEEEIKKNKLS